jgi:lysophospholipase L1-like esterase
MKYLKVAFLFLILFGANNLYAKIKIACIGNSITYGAYLPDRLMQNYPARLQQMLGDGYEVSNFGVNGTTILKNGNSPYWSSSAYQSALKSEPNIVFIALGTNDSKLVNRKHLTEFSDDYRALIKSFQNLASKPKVILLTPITVFKVDTSGIWDKPITDIMIPAIQKLAYQENLELLDLHSLFQDKEALMPDKVHPNAEGANFIAKRIFELLESKFHDFNIEKGIIEITKESSFFGYKDYEFIFKGRKAHVVKPKNTIKGNLWVWRARFFGNQPQADIALLERGYHVVYCDVAELYGNPEAIELWNGFYTYMQKLGLAKKAVLEGYSRGGIYVYAWASLNPKKVACVYTDNAVMDIKSWPGGFGKSTGNKKDWEIYKADFGYQTDEQAKAAKDSPIDKIKKIVKGKYPMLHIIADADPTVPMEENTLPFAELVKARGGDITIIHKPGFKHHPHSLPNPQPIVDFVLKATKK